MALSFYPIQPGTIISADLLNELIASIMNGTIFEPGNSTADLITGLADRVTSLESRVTNLEAIQSFARKREQFVLTANQSIINLSSVPNIDGELVFLNGVSLSKSGSPSLSDIRDYKVSGGTITLETALAALIKAGDFIAVVYEYEVL